MKKIWNRIVEKFIGEKMTEDEFYEEFPELSPIEEEGFVPLAEYEEEIKKETHQENQDKMKFTLNRVLENINDMSKKLLTNVKINDYIIDAILFTKKGIFLISFLPDEGYFRGKETDTYLDYFPFTKLENWGIRGNKVLPKYKDNPDKQILNPLGELVIWKQQIKKQKQFEKINFYTIILYRGSACFDYEYSKSPYIFSAGDLYGFINTTEKNIYTKEQLEEFYNSFVTYDN